MANDFNETLGSLFKGMDTMLTTKTVVGEPTKLGDTIILPLVDVNFGVAAGARMVSVKNEDTISKIIDMVPDIVDKIGNIMGKNPKSDDEEINQAISDIAHEEEI